MFSSLGTAEARMVIDLTQVEQSVQVAERAAEDIRRAFDSMAQQMAASTNISIQLAQGQAQAIQQSSAQIVQATQAAQKAVQQAAQGQGDSIREQIRIIDSVLSEMNAKLAQQQQQVQRTGASAFDKGAIQGQLSEYKDAVTEAGVRLKELKADFANFLSDPTSVGDPTKGLSRLNDIVGSYRQWFDKLSSDVQQFKAQSEASIGTPQQQLQNTQDEKEMAAIQKTMDAASAMSDKYIQEKAKEADAALTARQREAEAAQQEEERELAAIQKTMDAASAMSDKYIEEKAREAQAAIDARQREAEADRQAQADSFEQEIQTQAKLNQMIATAAEQRKQEQAQAVQQDMTGEVQQIQTALASARNQLSQEQNRFNQSNVGNIGVDPTEVKTQLEAARQPILELQQRLLELKQSFQEALTPADKGALIPEFEKLNAAAQDLSRNGMGQVTASINQFEIATEQASTGMEGFFNRLRQNLESLNETSLIANIQELSFRLMPLGQAAGQATSQGIDTAQQFQEMTLSFNSFTGSQKESVVLMDSLIAKAERFGLPMTEVLTTMQHFAPTIREAGGNLQQVMDLAGRILTLQPDAGFQTAIEAITKGIGGTDRSLLTQFHILPDTIKEAEKETGSFTLGLDKVLNQMGRTTQLAEQFGETNRSAATRSSDAWNKFLGTSMAPFLDFLTSISNMGTEVFNRLSENGGSFFTGAIGGVIALTAGFSQLLMVIGQAGLAYQGLSALAKSNFGKALGESLSGMVPGVGGFGMPALVPGAIAVAGGVAAGVGVAAAAGVGGTHDPNEEWTRLREVIFVALSSVAEALTVGVVLIKHAIDAIGTVLDLLATSIAKKVIDIVNTLNNAIAQAAESLHLPTAPELRKIADQGVENSQSRFVLTNPDGSTVSTSPQAGMQEGSDAEKNMAAKLGEGWKFVEGYSERIDRLNTSLKNGLDPNAILAEADAAATAIKKVLLGLIMPEVDQTPPPAKEVVNVNDPFYKLGQQVGGALNDASKSVQPFVDSIKDIPKILEQVDAAVEQYDIQTRRTQEDRAKQAARAEEDFTIQRTNAINDFNQQLLQSDNDYAQQRAQKIQDFNDQQQKAQDDENDQKKKQQDKFNQDELRRQQDFIIQMQRLGRDIDDAISARDFLSAQKSIQQQADQLADFNTETARRQADFAQQISDLDTNLKKQTDDRAADFQKQLKDQDQQHDTQRQRQITAFNLQLSREDQQRTLTQQRQAQDYALADQRREQDFNRQILDLISHNLLLNTIFSQGLDGLLASVRAWVNEIPVINGVIQQSSAPLPPGVAGPPTVGNSPTGGTTNPWLVNNGAVAGTGVGNTGGLPADVEKALEDLYKNYPHAANGFFNLPKDMMISAEAGESFIPPTMTDALMHNQLTLSGPRGNNRAPMTFQFEINIDATGKDMDTEQIVEVIEDRVVTKLAEKLEAMTHE